jgi:tRNA G18 (ribose-2'-O)-methylase SpoU
MKKITFLILSIFFLNSCSDDYHKKQDELKNQAIIDARSVSPEIHEAYIQCYALKHQDKNNCINKLNKQHIKIANINSNYSNAFQYEAERQGFINLLRRSNFNCNYLSQGPKFLEEAKAYIALCDNNELHFLRFDYVTHQWSIIK